MVVLSGCLLFGWDMVSGGRYTFGWFRKQLQVVHKTITLHVVTEVAPSRGIGLDLLWPGDDELQENYVPQPVSLDNPTPFHSFHGVNVNRMGVGW